MWQLFLAENKNVPNPAHPPPLGPAQASSARRDSQQRARRHRNPSPSHGPSQPSAPGATATAGQHPDCPVLSSPAALHEAARHPAGIRGLMIFSFLNTPTSTPSCPAAPANLPRTTFGTGFEQGTGGCPVLRTKVTETFSHKRGR